MSRLAIEIGTECTLQVMTLYALTPKSIAELREWEKQGHGTESERGARIRAAGIDLAYKSLEACVELMEIDKTEQFLEIAYTIGKSAGKFFGGDTIELVIRSIEAIRESKTIWDMPNRDARSTAKVLLEFDLFMMTSLLASQYAVAQVWALTRSLPLEAVELVEAPEAVAKRSRSAVVEELLYWRRQFAENGKKDLLKFPAEGFWANANPF